jgi:hypothetical protein
MEIDNTTATGDETIVLFPRSYNKRGDERLHSVQGLTLDGREVNVKLRIDESMLGKESTPSIAEFSREDVKAKNPCLATPDNAFDNREGVLLFTGCEVEGENRKGIPTFTARWAYVLASHSDDQDPVFGLGRVVIIADNQAVKAIHTELEDLEKLKPVGWEAIAERKRKALSDPLKLSYFGHLYQDAEEKSFPIANRDELTEFADSIFTSYTRSGVVGGVLIRLKDENGALIPGFSTEVFPRWIRQNTYQSGSDVMKFFFRAHDQRSTENGAATFVAMPIKRYACGPSFKNYYFLKKPDESLQKIRKHFLINNEPTVSRIALSLSLRQESGESFMLKYYPLTSPISSVATIGEEPPPADEVLIAPINGLAQIADSSMRPKVGLSTTTSLDFPTWYQPLVVDPLALSPMVRPEIILQDQEEPEQNPEPLLKTEHPAAETTVSLGQPTVGSDDSPVDPPDTPVLEVAPAEEPLEPPVSVEVPEPTADALITPDPQKEPTEELPEADSEEDDLSGMFSDISEQEIEEADRAAAEILAAVALEPAPDEEPVADQDIERSETSDVHTSPPVDSAEPISIAEVDTTPANEEQTTSIDESSQEQVGQAVVETQAPEQPIEELRIIDTSTEGQADAGAHNGVMLSEYTSTSKPTSAEPGAAPAAPEKKSALAMFLERQGLL